MSSIGAFSFMRMTGSLLPSIAARVTIIDRQGVDSTGSRLDGSKGTPGEIRTVEGYTLLANANAAPDNYGMLKGGYVTVVTDSGRTVNSVLVVEISDVQVQRVFHATGGAINYLVTAAWVLQPTT